MPPDTLPSLDRVDPPRPIASPPTSPSLPPREHDRVSSVDLLRGVAVLGILLINILSWGLPGAAEEDPTVAGGTSWPNLLAWAICHVLAAGKMRAIFSMLFGASVILFTARAEARGDGTAAADLYYRRTLWLIAFGILHAYFVWEWEILYTYGVVGLLLFPLRRCRPGVLVVAGLIILMTLAPKRYVKAREAAELHERVVAAAAAEARGDKLNPGQAEAREEWASELAVWKPGPEELASEAARHRSGYWKQFSRRINKVSRLQSIYLYRWGAFDAAGAMLIGMGLMKLRVFSAARSAPLYACMTLLGYGVGLPLNAWTCWRYFASGFDPVVYFYNDIWIDINRLIVAFGHIGLVMLVARAGLFRWLTRRLEAVGRMALTNYIMQSLIGTALFSGFGLGWYGRLERYQLYYVVAAIWAFQVLFSASWLRHFRFGPLEWLWKSLTYCRVQPITPDAR